MILNNADNRKLVTEFLASLSEDDFIEQFIIPIFSRNGYRVYRTVTHGPGEHGKDVIFARYDPLTMAQEFIAVQAKAEKVTTDNVNKFANQVDRAMAVGFPLLTGHGQQKPHTVFFINSRRHTNDANKEFLQLVKDPLHTHIFAQENVCDLVFMSGVAPKALLEKLNLGSPLDNHDIDGHVFKVLMEDEPAQVDHLLDHELELVRDGVSDRMQRMVIDFAVKKWSEDGSWGAIVRPIRWFNTYFEFFKPDQYRHLERVIEEYTDSYPSRAAAGYTHQVFQKISPEHIAAFGDAFVKLAVSVVMNRKSNWKPVAQLAKAVLHAKVVNSSILGKLVQYCDEMERPKEERDQKIVDALRSRLDRYLFDAP